MLTAWDVDRNRLTPLFYGTELAAANQIELLQQALLALSKTGLPLANPGLITGQVNRETAVALATVLLKLDVGYALKFQLVALAKDAIEYLGDEILSYLSGADEAWASFVGAVETAAPTLTSAVKKLTQERIGQTTTPTSPADQSLSQRLLAVKPGIVSTPSTRQELAPDTRPTASPSGKMATYVIAGGAVIGLGLLGWWLLKPG